MSTCRCLEFLLQCGATASLRDKQGYSPVHYAAAYGHRHCLELVSTRVVNTHVLQCKYIPYLLANHSLTAHPAATYQSVFS